MDKEKRNNSSTVINASTNFTQLDIALRQVFEDQLYPDQGIQKYIMGDGLFISTLTLKKSPYSLLNPRINLISIALDTLPKSSRLRGFSYYLWHPSYQYSKLFIGCPLIFNGSIYATRVKRIL